MLNNQLLSITAPDYTTVTLNVTPTEGNFRISLKRRWRRLSSFQRIVFTLAGILVIFTLVLLWQQSHSRNTAIFKLSDNVDVGDSVVKPIEPFLNRKKDIQSARKLPILVPDASDVLNRTHAVLQALRHTWEAYRRYAWGKDELHPISGTSSTWMDAALTMVDSLDTLWIAGMHREFYEARDWIEKNLSFTTNNDRVNLFETVIRVLGGLLSAHILSGDKLFLEKAIDLGDRLLPAFDTPSGIPFSDINLSTRVGNHPVWTTSSSLSEVTTMQLELNELSRLSSDPKYSKAGMKALDKVLHQAKLDGLAPIFINVNTGSFVKDATVTFGARGDSYYEYLLKVWIQRGKQDTQLKKSYIEAIKGLKRHLIRRSKPNGLLFVGELLSGRTFSNKMDHLVCYLPGTLAYGVLHGMPNHHMELAKQLAHTCNQMYVQMATGLSPEIAYFNTETGDKDIIVHANDAHNLQRPETIESFYYLYKITGDPMYRTWAWNIFQAFERYTRIEPLGYVSISDVTNTKNVGKKDKCESFWLAETLKYFFLIFTDDNKLLPLNRYVFNTEAHPFPIKLEL